MESLESEEVSNEGPNQWNGVTKLQADRHDTPMVEASDMTTTALLAKAVEIQSAFRQSGRRDSVISDFTVPAVGSKGVDGETRLTRKPMNLGTSILKTSSLSGSSKSSATPPLDISSKHGTSVLQTPPHTAGSKATTPPHKTAGSTWLTNFDGHLWPVVLCDEQITPEKFMERRHNRSHLPAIQLGKRKYIWVISETLKPFYWDRDYLIGAKRFDTDDVLPTDSEGDGEEKLRQRAFNRDASMGQGHEFWMNVIQQRSGERQASKLRDQKGHKRSRQSYMAGGSKNAGNKHFGHGNSAHQWKKIRHRSPKGRKKAYGLPFNSTSSDEDDVGILVAKRSRRAFIYRDLEGEDEEGASEEQRRIQNYYRQGFENKKGICTIFIGTGEKKATFDIPNSNVGQCVALTSLMKHSDGPDQQSQNSYINLDETDADIKAEDFKAVAAFLMKGSFAPHVVKGRQGRIVLECIRTTDDADEAAQNLAKIYNTASSLHFDSLQQHCVGQLRVLPQTSPLAILTVMVYFNGATVHDCKAERDMEVWLVERISRSFWQLVAQHGEAFERLMRSNIHLRMSVLGRVAGFERGIEYGEEEGEEEDWESE